MASTKCGDDETDEWDSVHVNLMSAPASSWVDEVDEVDEVCVRATLTAEDLNREERGKAKNSVDAMARKRAVNNRQRAKIESMLRAGETDEQRRLREREAQEEEDTELAGDIFGANVSDSSNARQTLDNFNLRSKDDHQQIAEKIGTKLVSSKRQHVMVFLKETMRLGGSNLNIGDWKELAALISLLKQNAVVEDKKKKRAMEANKRAEMKKEHKAKDNADLLHQEDLFGGTKLLHDEYEHWDDLEDNFL
jgi:hypothetical protein